MKFRTKLFNFFISLGLICVLLALFIAYGEASRLIFNEIRSKALILGINSAQLIDAGQVEQLIANKGDKNSPEYEAIHRSLLKIREINRHDDVYLEHIYLIHRSPKQGQYSLIIGPKGINHFGERYNSSPILPENVEAPFVSDEIVSHGKKNWISGFTPIVNEEGRQVAILALEVNTKEMYQVLEKLFYYGIIAFVFAISIAAIFAYYLSTIVSSSLSTLCETVKKVGEGDLEYRSHLTTQDEFNDLSIAINQMAKGLQEREVLKERFVRYVSHHALEKLLDTDVPLSLFGERKKVTILFSDLRDFTAISEKLPPEEVLQLLNEYFEAMIEVIFKFNGTLDKFIGDGMMIEFGAPLEDENQEFHAVLTALHMQLNLEKLNDKWEGEGKARLSMGIGIHTGLVVLGNVGSERRMEYTAIGDAVNISARLERMTKRLNKSVIVSKAIHDKTKDYFYYENLQEMQLPGRTGYIQAYALDLNDQTLQSIQQMRPI